MYKHVVFYLKTLDFLVSGLDQKTFIHHNCHFVVALLRIVTFSLFNMFDYFLLDFYFMESIYLL